MYDLFLTWIYHRKPQDTKNRPVLRTTVPAAPRQPEPRYARESGRWGEADNVYHKVHIEKGPVDLFPAEPTDEPFMARRP